MRSAKSTLSPDRFFPRYPCGRWHGASNTLLAFSVSKLCLFRSVVCAYNCLRVHARVYARALRSSTLAVGLVLRNAADAVQSSFMMRSLPHSVVRQNLLILIRSLLHARLMVFLGWMETTYMHEWNINAL